MSSARRTSLYSMAIQRILAQSTVSDLATADRWYSALFMRQPDARPMPGLLEWHLDDTFGVQVWSEPDRAGRSSICWTRATSTPWPHG